MPYFVYMLRCAKGRIYTGYTTDVAARYAKHCSGKGASFTRAFPPIGILKVFGLEGKKEALSLEARIKHCSRAQKEKFVQLPEDVLPDIPKKQKKRKRQKQRKSCFICKQTRNDGGAGPAKQAKRRMGKSKKEKK